LVGGRQQCLEPVKARADISNVSKANKAKESKGKKQSFLKNSIKQYREKLGGP